MLLEIARKEFLESLLNRRFMAVAALSVILLPVSGLINYQYFETRRASFDSQYAGFLADRSESQIRAYRPPELLSVLAQGTEPFMPIYYELGTNDSNLGELRSGNIEAEDFRLLSALGSIDFLFLVQVVFSLLAVLLSFDMVAGEKERSTLKAVLANSVPRDKVVLGKAIGGLAVLLAVFLLGALLLVLTLALFDGRFLDPPTFARVVTILGLSMLFLAGFFLLGLMVSTACHSGRTSIIVLLIVWVLLQLVIPKGAETVAKVVRPVRSEEQLRVEKASIISELDDRKRNDAGDIYRRVFGSQQLNSRRIGEDTPEALRFKEEYQRLSESLWQEKANRLADVEEGYERETRSQRRLAYGLSMLSPASAYGFLASDVAGTGDFGYESYQDQVANYYAQLRAGPLLKLQGSAIRVRLGGSSVWMGGDNPPDWDAIPVFSSEPVGVGESVVRNSWSLVCLIFYVIVPFLVAYVLFLRYDVR